MTPPPPKPARPVQLQRIDLNLMRVFNAIYQERHVTRAGLVMHTSQSAVSHGLRSLRIMFKDPLFVRTPDGMEPTALADRLAEQIRAPLEELQQAFFLSNTFDASVTDRDFVVGVTAPLHPYFVADLCRAVRMAAPGARLTVRSLLGGEVVDALDRRQVDLVVGDTAMIGDTRRIRHDPIVEAEVVCVVAASNSAVGEVLDVKTYASMPHLAVASDKLERTWIDDLLAKKGLGRRITTIVPSTLHVGQIIPDSPLVCTIMSTLVARSPRLRFLPPPFPNRAYRFGLIWHARADAHAPTIWLRGLLRRVWDESRTREGATDA